MRQIRRYITKNWLLIVVGLILTEISVTIAYDERGYFAVGGEYLVLPILLLTAQLIRDFAKFVMELPETEETYGRKRDTRHHRSIQKHRMRNQ